jgi:hypothetical protein
MVASVNSSCAPRGPRNRSRPSLKMRLRWANSIKLLKKESAARCLAVTGALESFTCRTVPIVPVNRHPIRLTYLAPPNVVPSARLMRGPATFNGDASHDCRPKQARRLPLLPSPALPDWRCSRLSERTKSCWCTAAAQRDLAARGAFSHARLEHDAFSTTA